MVRFFTDSDTVNMENPLLTGDNAQHAKVLRLKVGEDVLLCDGEGRVYKNADLPWTVEPGEEGFAEAYPGLTAEKQND